MNDKQSEKEFLLFDFNVFIIFFYHPFLQPNNNNKNHLISFEMADFYFGEP